jgi:hypothetical protein
MDGPWVSEVDDPAGLAATASVDALPKGGVSDLALLVWRYVVSVRAFARMRTSQNRDMGHRFCGGTRPTGRIGLRLPEE